MSITIYANHHTVACTAVAMQRPRDKANKQRPFLDDGSVNTLPRQLIRTQQEKNGVFYVVRADKL
jgi:hypothetical protein